MTHTFWNNVWRWPMCALCLFSCNGSNQSTDASTDLSEISGDFEHLVPPVDDGYVLPEDGGGEPLPGEDGQTDSDELNSCRPMNLAISSTFVSLPEGCPGEGCTSTGLIPLTELGTSQVLGFDGGLYCAGSNTRPPAHEAAGKTLAESIVPLDAEGRPDQNGKFALLAIGMSNTGQEFGYFRHNFNNDFRPEVHDQLVMVNGCLAGNASVEWRTLESLWTDHLSSRLLEMEVTRAQVVAAWVKLTNIGPQQYCDQAGFVGLPCFPAADTSLYNDLVIILQRLHTDFPNLKLVYLSSRVYAGYASGPLSLEPYAYQNGLAIKALVQNQISGDPALNFDPSKGEIKVPWLSWGPYLWADGTTPRSDGLVWLRSDFIADGVHPSDPNGRLKVATLLFEFFATDATTSPWFLDP